MIARRLTFCTLLMGALLVPSSASSQIFGGVFGAYAQDAFDGVSGVGLEFGYDLPILPVDVYGSGSWFFPDCDECDLSGWSLGANLRLPLPLIRPYLTGGWTWRDYEDPGPTIDPLSLSDNNVFAGVGVDLAFSGVRVFGEARYDLLDEPLEQWTLRLGLFLR